MRRPTETALKSRARALLETMTARLCWIYAVPRDDGPAAVRAVALADGLVAKDEATFANEKGTATIVMRDDADLDVLFVEAQGEDAPPILGKILDQAGFYAQSTLLGTAFDVRDEEAPSALGTLAFMVVAWDEPWRELFALHLGAPDPAVRRAAIGSLLSAVATARANGPAAALLDAAIAKEKDAELAEALRSAREKLG
jgi:hypothetical protein